MRLTYEVVVDVDTNDATGKPEKDQIEDWLHDAAKEATCASFGVSAADVTVNVYGDDASE